MEARDFRPTPTQRAFLEGASPPRILLNQRSGRRLATEMWIRSTAATPQEAELAIADLHTRGVAMLDGKGHRLEPGGRPRFTIVKFDEEPVRPSRRRRKKKGKKHG